ncbi:hypothetical protein BC834DRAFT_267624 [Gloeopeniophorella convolvens]|nr:hypothetical protein BC834DRAFT_267624 [Gloeopeniophorella convolvens]
MPGPAQAAPLPIRLLVTPSFSPYTLPLSLRHCTPARHPCTWSPSLYVALLSLLVSLPLFIGFLRVSVCYASLCPSRSSAGCIIVVIMPLCGGMWLISDPTLLCTVLSRIGRAVYP